MPSVEEGGVTGKSSSIQISCTNFWLKLGQKCVARDRGGGEGVAERVAACGNEVNEAAAAAT